MAHSSSGRLLKHYSDHFSAAFFFCGGYNYNIESNLQIVEMYKVANKETKQPPASLLPKPYNLSFSIIKWILGFGSYHRDANLKVK
jgi:hypothetical protein